MDCKLDSVRQAHSSFYKLKTAALECESYHAALREARAMKCNFIRQMDDPLC